MIVTDKRSLSFIIILLTLIMFAALGQQAEASNTPSSTLGVGPGTSCQYSTLTAALASANSGDQINLGVTTLNSTFAYDIQNKSLTIVGGYDSNCLVQTRGRTTLKQIGVGGVNVAASVINIISTSSPLQHNVTLRNLNIINGDPASSGGGIAISGSVFVGLHNTHIYDNHSASHGGGVYLAEGTLLLEDGSAVYDNKADGDGGGIYCDGGSVIISDSNLGLLGGNEADADGDASGGRGGGFFGTDCPMQMVNGSIANNLAREGGGVAAGGNGHVHLDGPNAKIIGNQASLSAGGAWMFGSTSMDISGGIVNDNSAENDAGGLLIAGSASLTVDKEFCDSDACAQLSGNRANGHGGGIYLQLGASAMLTGVEMRGNSADASGSAIAIYGAMTLLNSIVSDGKGAAGPIAINAPSVTTLQFSTFAYNNLTSTQPAFKFVGGTLNANAIIVYGGGPSGTYGGTPTSINFINSIADIPASVGSNNLVANPMFVMDGPDGDYHLSIGSPAIDHVSLELGPMSDFDLQARPMGYPALWDAGADEFNDFIGLNGATCSFATIADAVAAAEAGDTVHIPMGQYNERIGAVDKELSFVASEEDCSAEVTTGNFNNVVILGDNLATVPSGGIVEILNSSHVTFTRISLTRASAELGGIASVGTGSGLTLDNSRLSEGDALTGPGFGGGLYTTGNVILRNGSCITEGESQQHGGGAYVGVDGSLTLEDSSCIGTAGSGNLAGAQGGGVYVFGSLTLLGSSEIASNSADYGGGIYADFAATVQISSNAEALSENKATFRGGGLYAKGIPGLVTSQVVIDSGAFLRGNTADFGGAIYADAVDVLTLNNATLDANIAAEGGGGIYIINDPNGAPHINMTNVTLSNNAALSSDWGGGGLWLDPDTSAYVNDVTFSGNSTAGEGGAIYISDAYATVTSTNFISNSAVNGGAVSGFGLLEVNAGTTFDQNSASENGGAIHRESGSLTTIASGAGTIVLSHNTATGSGGAIYIMNGNLSAEGQVEILSNSAGNSGGGIYQFMGDGALLETADGRPLISQNVAINGGGIYLTNVDQTSGTVSGDYIDGVTISDNSAWTGTGGGLHLANSTVNLTNAQVNNNIATMPPVRGGLAAGGGLAILGGSLVKVDSSAACNPNLLAANRYCSEISDNATLNGGELGGLFEVSGEGAGIFLDIGELTIARTALIGNDALTGGAIYMTASANLLNMNNNLIAENGGEYAVKVDDFSSLSMANTTMAANEDKALFVQNAGLVTFYDYNIVWGGDVTLATGSLSASCSISQNGVAGSAPDPQFIATARGNYRLGAGSPALDACFKGPDDDLDQQARPVFLGGDGELLSHAYDMGAFEMQAIPTAVALADSGVISAELTPITLLLALLLIPVSCLCARPRLRAAAQD